MLQTQLLTSAALFTAFTLANPQFNIDTAEATKVVTDGENFATSITANPTFQTDVAILESALPSSLVAAALSNPNALIAAYGQQAAPTLPPAASSAIDSLETLAAKPLAAVSDIYAYAQALATQPAVASVLSVLQTAVPSSVQAALASDPASFLQNAITQTAEPSWVAALPSDVQSDIGSVLNKGLGIVASDLEGQSAPTGSGVGAAGGKSSGMVAVATGGAGGQGGGNGTKPTTGAPAPAATFKAEGARGTVAVGCVVLAAVGGVFFGL